MLRHLRAALRLSEKYIQLIMCAVPSFRFLQVSFFSNDVHAPSSIGTFDEEVETAEPATGAPRNNTQMQLHDTRPHAHTHTSRYTNPRAEGGSSDDAQADTSPRKASYFFGAASAFFSSGFASKSRQYGPGGSLKSSDVRPPAGSA